MALLSGTLKDTLNESGRESAIGMDGTSIEADRDPVPLHPEDRGNFVEAQTNEVNVQYRCVKVHAKPSLSFG